MLKDGFSAEEVETAKSGWLKRDMVSRAQDAQLARRLGSLAFYERTMSFDAERMKKIQALTPADVLAAMKRHVDPARISIFKAGDFKKAGIDPKL
jgi:zinc protease